MNPQFLRFLSILFFLDESCFLEEPDLPPTESRRCALWLGFLSLLFSNRPVVFRVNFFPTLASQLVFRALFIDLSLLFFLRGRPLRSPSLLVHSASRSCLVLLFFSEGCCLSHFRDSLSLLFSPRVFFYSCFGEVILTPAVFLSAALFSNATCRLLLLSYASFEFSKDISSFLDSFPIRLNTPSCPSLWFSPTTPPFLGP